MLTKATKEDAEKYLDFAYALALDPSRSGYPTYTDGIKTRGDFVKSAWRALTDPSRELLLFRKDGIVMGWIQFFTIPEDRYLQTEVFNIAGDTEKALSEFALYCAEKYAGYTAYLGFPGENLTALTWLAEHGWTREEKSWNDVIHLEAYTPGEEDPDVVPVTVENFSDFRLLHSRNEETVYWNADRILHSLKEWQIFLYHRAGCPVGAVYTMGGGETAEIFGIDLADGADMETVYRVLLNKTMNVCKEKGQKHIVFFNDTETQDAALKAGFQCVGEYVLYVRSF